MQGEAVYPVSRRPAASFLAYLGEVVGRDAEAGGIIRNIPVPDVFAVVKQFDELLQQPGGMFRHLPGRLSACMDVIQVEDMRHQQVAQHLFAEQVRLAVGQSFAEPFQVIPALPEVVRGKLHHRVLQQAQMPDDAVIVAYGHRQDKRFGQSHRQGTVIFRPGEAGSQRHVGQYDVIARYNIIMYMLEMEAHASPRAEDVNHALGMPPEVVVLN